jgi:hypothetical protein
MVIARGAVASLALLTTSLSRAEPAAAQTALVSSGSNSVVAPPPSLLSRWYGWQTLLVDAASLTVGAGGHALGVDGEFLSTATATAGVAGYVLAAPTIHWLHGQRERAGWSLGLRLVLPMAAVGVAAIVGASAHSSSEHCPAKSEAEYERYCEPRFDHLATVAVTSVLAGSLIDASVIAWEPPPPRNAGLALAPVLAWDGARGGRLGLVGEF